MTNEGEFNIVEILSLIFINHPCRLKQVSSIERIVFMTQDATMNSNEILHQIQVRHCWIGPLSKGRRRARWVLLVASQSVMDESVLALLERDHALRVAIVTFMDDTKFLEDVAALRPVVILLNEVGPLHLPDLLSLIKQSPALARTRIITYGIDDKAVEVYDHRRVVIEESEDFLKLLHF